MSWTPLGPPQPPPAPPPMPVGFSGGRSEFFHLVKRGAGLEFVTLGFYRFWMSGSGWIYALQASLWGLLMIVTLGLALPWRVAALERYKMRHSYYGDLQGSFEGRGWEFFKRGWWLWLLTPIAIYVPPLAPFVYGAFKAVEWRWWLSGIRFGGVRLESTLRRSELIGLYWKVVGWIVVLG